MAAYAGFYQRLTTVHNSSDRLSKVKLIIGKIKLKNINYAAILNAIANAEMGFEPKLSETILFIGTKTNNIFHMYDDRGCTVESNVVDRLKNLYQKRNVWIVDYYRAEIDKQFQ